MEMIILAWSIKSENLRLIDATQWHQRETEKPWRKRPHDKQRSLPYPLVARCLFCPNAEHTGGAQRRPRTLACKCCDLLGVALLALSTCPNDGT
ncbi:hypothetical protein HDN1F_29710 [gamma proteobacterium HdN1]|nr:hypothetical protein HDN1F_29710 [gamma proteobacterium HdN1]